MTILSKASNLASSLSESIRGLTDRKSCSSVGSTSVGTRLSPALMRMDDMAISLDSTVFVVDDDDAMCRLIQNLVESIGLKARLFGSAQLFIEQFDPTLPGCLVSDVRMPGMSGVELQELLVQKGSLLPVILVTAHADVPLAVRAMKSHAVDVLEKPFKLQDLLDRIQHALRIDAERRQEHAKKTGASSRVAQLSERERQVMKMVVTGLANKQIAHRLDLSEKTIEAHRSHVMKKLGVSSLAELVRLAVLAE
jgi:two-component system response regulator FixJ